MFNYGNNFPCFNQEEEIQCNNNWLFGKLFQEDWEPLRPSPEAPDILNWMETFIFPGF